MKKVLLIGGSLLAIFFLSYIYLKKFVERISFDLDVVPNILKSESGKFAIPVRILIDNKNKKGITIRDVNITILKNDKIIAKSEEDQDFKVDGGKITTIDHKFSVVDLNEITRILFSKNEEEVKVVTSFRFLIIPITISTMQKI